jgi:capsular exopolysaccharide synthesis family protein
MAKVYDALRRAEEERKRRSGQLTEPMAPVEWEPTGHTVQPGRTPLWKRWLAALTSRRSPAASGPSDVNKRRISLLQPDSYAAEQFRALRGRIDSLGAQRPVRTIAVTSALPGEGKTTASINLAAVTAMSVGRRVLLIDCDLRKPKIHQALGLRPEAGLAEVLTDTKSLDQAIVKVEGVNLEVLAVRSRPANPSELLASARMREIVEEVAERYDRVVLDTPAALGLPDSKTVSELCDGLVVVVRADVTSTRDLQATLEIMDRSRLLGLVMNGAQIDQSRYGYMS